MKPPRHENKILFLRMAIILGPIILGLFAGSAVEAAPEWVTTLKDHWVELSAIVAVLVYGGDKVKYNKAVDAWEEEMADMKAVVDKN